MLMNCTWHARRVCIIQIVWMQSLYYTRCHSRGFNSHWVILFQLHAISGKFFIEFPLCAVFVTRLQYTNVVRSHASLVCDGKKLISMPIIPSMTAPFTIPIQFDIYPKLHSTQISIRCGKMYICCGSAFFLHCVCVWAYYNGIVRVVILCSSFLHGPYVYVYSRSWRGFDEKIIRHGN